MVANPVEGGTATDVTDGSPYTEGTVVDILAVPDTGWVFLKWESDAGGTFDDATDPDTNFTMPGNDVTVTANFVPNVPGGQVYNQNKDMFYDTIQEAINAADPGDTLWVGNGTYEEALLIDRSITLKAAEEHGATVTYHEDAGDESSEKTIRVEADDVIIKDLVLSRTRDEDNGVAQAIRVNGSNVEINNNIINGNVGYGISVQSGNDEPKTDNVTITKNITGFSASIGVIAMLGTPDAGTANEIGTVTITDNELLDYSREGLQVSAFGDHGGSIDEIIVTDNYFNSVIPGWHVYEVVFANSPVLDWDNIIGDNDFEQNVYVDTAADGSWKLVRNVP